MIQFIISKIANYQQVHNKLTTHRYNTGFIIILQIIFSSRAVFSLISVLTSLTSPRVSSTFAMWLLSISSLNLQTLLFLLLKLLQTGTMFILLPTKALSKFVLLVSFGVFFSDRISEFKAYKVDRLDFYLTLLRFLCGFIRYIYVTLIVVLFLVVIGIFSLLLLLLFIVLGSPEKN